MAISAENRFDAAYKAIMQLSNVALQANGYRTLTREHLRLQPLLRSCVGNDHIGKYLEAC